MRQGTLILAGAALAALVVLLLAPPVFGAQDGGKVRAVPGKAAEDESSKALLTERERMKEEYLKMRKERREALEATLVKNVGGTGPLVRNVGGSGPVASVEMPEAVLEAPPAEQPVPPPTPASKEDHFVLYVVGCGMVVGLLVKVAGPRWINQNVFRIGRRKKVPAGAMTVQLRPRRQRLTGS